MLVPQGDLASLALQYLTDKGPQSHNYVRDYEPLFAPLRDKQLTLLEIGVLNGASIQMWSDYFPNGKIVGVDKDLKQFTWRPNVLLLQANVSTGEILQQVAEHAGPLDIVIDDGSHNHGDHMIALFELMQFLEPDGMYFIEDLHGDHITKQYLKLLQASPEQATMYHANSDAYRVLDVQLLYEENLALIRWGKVL